MIIFTSICANYTHKARTLARSVKEHIPGAQFFVCLTEKKDEACMNYEFFDKVILSKDIWKGNFERFIFKHTIVEASTAVKARFFQYLMETYQQENEFIYLDPDCYVYSDFIELKELLEYRPIVLCPHLLQAGNIDMELSSTAHGVYNLGFLAVNHSDEAKRLIDWWADRLSIFCYDDIKNGIFTDQKWMDLVPCFFDAEILKHHGYDLAPWSLLECEMTEKEGVYYVKGDPLRFIHFSGYGASAEWCMDHWLPKGDHLFKRLYQEYSIVHKDNDKDQVSKIRWSYGYYDSGKKISDGLRLKYRKVMDMIPDMEDPFLLNNAKIRKRLWIAEKPFRKYSKKLMKKLVGKFDNL